MVAVFEGDYEMHEMLVSKIDRFRDDATSVNRGLRKLRFCSDLLTACTETPMRKDFF